MFLVRDKSSERERKIRSLMKNDPAIAVIVASVQFEWLVRRAILSLAVMPNKKLREEFEKMFGFDGYKNLWKEHVKPSIGKGLPQIIKNWSNVKKGFELRNKLVHGVESCTAKYASDRVEWLLKGSAYLWEFCKGQGFNLDERLKVRNTRSSKPG